VDRFSTLTAIAWRYSTARKISAATVRILQTRGQVH
jgi:hypothetical protein